MSEYKSVKELMDILNLNPFSNVAVFEIGNDEPLEICSVNGVYNRYSDRLVKRCRPMAITAIILDKTK